MDTNRPEVKASAVSSTFMDASQHQRAEALERARGVLAQRNLVSSGSASGMELVGVASYIVTGVDPYRTQLDE